MVAEASEIEIIEKSMMAKIQVRMISWIMRKSSNLRSHLKSKTKEREVQEELFKMKVNLMKLIKMLLFLI